MVTKGIEIRMMINWFWEYGSLKLMVIGGFFFIFFSVLCLLSLFSFPSFLQAIMFVIFHLCYCFSTAYPSLCAEFKVLLIGLWSPRNLIFCWSCCKILSLYFIRFESNQTMALKLTVCFLNYSISVIQNCNILVASLLNCMCHLSVIFGLEKGLNF